jgi:thymidylate synthase (FAD)
MRPESPDLEAILDHKFSVLDDGFVRVVDYLGNDASIVQAARVSYGAGTKSVQEDSALIRYLVRHAHTTPLEMCEIKLHVRAPMDTWRQWIRHRTANVNEYSTRYSVAIDSAAKTDAANWRVQDSTNRQGSSGLVPLDVGTRLSAAEAKLQREAREVYEERLRAGVAREQARKDLPLSTYTEAYWKIDLHNLFSFLRLRMRADAQFEIRSYASLIGNEIVKRWCPIAWAAFVDYSYNSLSLSSREIDLIRTLKTRGEEAAKELAIRYRWINSDETVNEPSRERKEAIRKLEELGITLRWLKPKAREAR